DRITKSMAPAIGGATSLSIVGALALALTSLGLYGTIGYAVSRRTYEIGIRRALGAADGDVLRLVVSDAVRLVLAGAVIGLAAGLIGAPLGRSLLYCVDRFDPVVFGVSPLVLIAVCAVASSIPAWRAIRINPAEALRRQ